MPTTLILTMVGLLFLLIALVFLYVWSSRLRRSKSAVLEPIETFESLCALLRDPRTPNGELHRAVSVISDRYCAISPQTIGAYQKAIEALCTHPHTDSKLVIRFEKALRAANPHFTHEIERSLAIGLAKRG